MNTPQSHDPFDDDEARLARIYRALPSGEPPASLDARILAQARAAVEQPKPAKRPTWLYGAGVAASAVLALGLIWKLSPLEWKPVPQPESRMRSEPAGQRAPLQTEPEQPAEQSATPGAEPVAQPEAPFDRGETAGAASDRASTIDTSMPAKTVREPAVGTPPEPAAHEADTPASSMPESPRPLQPDVSTPEPIDLGTLEELPAATAAPPPSPPAPPPPESATPVIEQTPIPAFEREKSAKLQDDASAGREPDDEGKRGLSGRMTKPARSEADSADVSAMDEAKPKVDGGLARDRLQIAEQLRRNSALSPSDWLLRIVALNEDGQIAEARANLRAFRQRYPDHPLPASLQALLDEDRHD